MYIKLENLVKRFGKNIAVDNLSLSIQKGEIFGLLGPNGAGKSTTINMIMGISKPNKGEIIIENKQMNRDNKEMFSKIGFVPQELAIYGDMTARENVNFFGRLYGLRGKILEQKTERALNFVGLDKNLKKKSKNFSGGMKRRLNIACSIVHDPELIIMDEPTVGIDPQSRNHILESVKTLNKNGATIIYTTHYMEEVEELCNRIGIIDNGRLIALGTKEELKLQVSEEEKLIFKINDVNRVDKEKLEEMDFVTNVCIKNDKVEVKSSKAQTTLQDLLYIFTKDNLTVKNITLYEPNLQDVFLSLTGRTLRN